MESSVNCSAPAAIATPLSHTPQTIFILSFTTLIPNRIDVVLALFCLLNNESIVLNNENESRNEISNEFDIYLNENFFGIVNVSAYHLVCLSLMFLFFVL